MVDEGYVRVRKCKIEIVGVTESSLSTGRCTQVAVGSVPSKSGSEDQTTTQHCPYIVCVVLSQTVGL